jgi:CheY-like chemotaxis protein
LVVEDDELTVELIAQISELLGVTIRLASNASEALELMSTLEEHTVCVFVDYNVPGMHASQLLSRIGELVGRMPIVVSSSYPESFVTSDLPVGSFDAFLPKPFAAQALLRVLKQFIPVAASPT